MFSLTPDATSSPCSVFALKPIPILPQTQTHNHISTSISVSPTHLHQRRWVTSPILSPLHRPQRSAPFREDCWSEDATSTLVDAWGRRYIELNRGNSVRRTGRRWADAVNARHGHVKKARRTDVQCKNRIDTIKKKPSSASPPLALPLPYWKTPSPAAPSASVGALPQKRPMPAVDDSYFRRNYSAVAAAAAAEAVDEDEDEEEEEEESRWSAERSGDVDGMRQLARAIERMKMFMDTQVQLEKIKRAKRSGLNDAVQSLHRVWLAMIFIQNFANLLVLYPDSEAVNNFSLLYNSGGLTPWWLHKL
ncbi:Trihelix transcription factor ASIL2 [Vitis vinifera]|uniref:Trihelix transcription factor ASIL2 n=1 Tax=Vitis vinifera TaxID=29760 RepID=A0A438BPT9_VITVI|nr:Trihelix transcription factor ASIL2 [Vitis vinifera]